MLAQTHDPARADELDTGPRSGTPGAERFCAVAGAARPVNAMIRFVVGPDGGVVPDIRRRLPGRGLWITATREALGQAVKRKIFARGFKRDVRVPPGLVDLTEQLLQRAALEALPMAHKAGRIAIGFAKSEAALMNDRVAALLNAAEAAPDGTRKLIALLRRRDDADRIAVVDRFTSAQLDLAFGRSNVIHAALLAGPESETFLARVSRMEHFRTGCPEDQGVRDHRR